MSFSELENSPKNHTLPLASLVDHLKFNEQGLVPAIAQEHQSKQVLMLAWMNKQALSRTIETQQVWYWSRSRQKLWRKGESSGNTQTLIDLQIDCDGDTVLLYVKQNGAACHTLRPHCFYWQVEKDNGCIRCTHTSPKSI